MTTDTVSIEKAKASLGQFLKAKTEAGQSFGKIAQRTGIDKATLVRACNGFSTPTIKTILALCDTYEISPNQLLGWKNVNARDDS